MSKKWTDQKIRETIEVLQRHTDYQTAIEELGETKDSIYNAFNRQGFYPPSEYLASSQEQIERRKKMEPDKALQTILIGSDFHFPFHNVRGVRNFLKFAGDLQPDHIVLNGDLLDCYTVSAFPKAPGMPDLQAELDMGIEFLQDLKSACPTAKITFIEGNHEERLKRFMKTNKALYGLRCFQLPKLLRLDELDIDYVEYGDCLDFHSGVYEISITHGHKVRKHSAYSAKGHLLDEYYANVIHGHTHRIGTFYQDGKLGRRRAFEIGGLFDRDQADYVTGEKNWQNGFAVLYTSKGSDCQECGRAHDPEYPAACYTVEMQNNGTFVWNGKIYDE